MTGLIGRAAARGDHRAMACRLVLGAALTLVCACDGDREAASGREELAGARAQAIRLWEQIDEHYRDWPASRPAPVRAEEPHGVWIRVHYNGVAAAALGGSGPWPDGAIIATEDFAPDLAGPRLVEAINVMHKRDGSWFWARFSPPDPTPAASRPRLTRRTHIPIAGGELLRCASCHRQQARRDHVISVLR